MTATIHEMMNPTWEDLRRELCATLQPGERVYHAFYGAGEVVRTGTGTTDVLFAGARGVVVPVVTGELVRVK